MDNKIFTIKIREKDLENIYIAVTQTISDMKKLGMPDHCIEDYRKILIILETCRLYN